MINPAHSLPFSVQANPGGYTLLLGSGVSKAAKIPTGWEIMLDLIGKLAAEQGEAVETDLENWYVEKYKIEPNYSTLLDVIAKTQTERQQLLRPYFEPNDEERERGEKQPTAAHQAIAALAAQGFIKVIITTNFDRLIETALKNSGIEPTVLSSVDQITGMLPLHRIQCCLIKLHGDYLDPAHIKNTTTELGNYPDDINQLLDRIFDEYGLIVCGWSAEWDGALRDALFRTKSRRFGTYWAVHGEKRDKTDELLNHIQAEEIFIQDADSFFQELQHHVEAIRDYSKQHHLSAEIAVVSLKRFLSDSKYEIQLFELIENEVKRIIEITSSDSFSLQNNTINPDSVKKRFRQYEAACSTLLDMAVVGGFWAEPEHYEMWERALRNLIPSPLPSDGNAWKELCMYPATLLLYALGFGAVEAGRFEFFGHLLDAQVCREGNNYLPAFHRLPPALMFSSDGRFTKMLEGEEVVEGSRSPLNDWIHKTLQPFTKNIVIDDNRYTYTFDKLELLILLCFRRKYNREGFAPKGRERGSHENYNLIIREIYASLSQKGNNSPFTICNIFGENDRQCRWVLDRIESEI